MLSVPIPASASGGSTNPAYTQRETERFLFYRGIGHLDSPLRATMAYSETFVLCHTGPIASPSREGWFVDIKSDELCAFHHVSNLQTVEQNKYLMWSDGFYGFKSKDYSSANLSSLKSSMEAALVTEGLYPDEASAMLRTWELSYFKSPGLRFFYLVPRKWVDEVLPLQITGAPAHITRVMIGRIELITDAQRAALARLAAGPCPDLPGLKAAAQQVLRQSKLPPEQIAAFYRGEKPLADLGLSIPPLVQDYLSLGRFRDALIVHENQDHPTPALAQFIQENQLAPGER
jgi:hypothetical protein